MTEPGGPAWRQTTFYPFAHASRFGRVTVLRVEPGVPALETTMHGPVPLLEATATLDEEGREVTLFAVNRDRREPVEVVGDRGEEHVVLTDDVPRAANTLEDPGRVRPTTGPGAEESGGRLRASLPRSRGKSCASGPREQAHEPRSTHLWNGNKLWKGISGSIPGGLVMLFTSRLRPEMAARVPRE